jgi:DNA invertase Pin-like site-specific DNA recombinase
MLKAAAYARYSSDNQRDESIDAQLRAIREYCQKITCNLSKYTPMRHGVQPQMIGPASCR